MYPVFLGAVVIGANNKTIRIVEGASTSDVDLVEGTYFLRGDGSSDDLALAVKTALNTATGSNVYTVSVSRYLDVAQLATAVDITQSGGANFQLQWAAAQTTFDPGLLGFPATNTALNDLVKTSSLSASCCWTSNDPHRELEPFNEKRVSVRRSTSAKVRGVERSAKMRSWRLSLGFVHDTRMLIPRNSADPTATLESFMDSYGANARFEVHDLETASAASVSLEATTSSTLVAQMHFSEGTLSNFEPMRVAGGTPLYSWSGVLHERVA